MYVILTKYEVNILPPTRETWRVFLKFLFVLVPQVTSQGSEVRDLLVPSMQPGAGSRVTSW